MSVRSVQTNTLQIMMVSVWKNDVNDAFGQKWRSQRLCFLPKCNCDFRLGLNCGRTLDRNRTNDHKSVRVKVHRELGPQPYINKLSNNAGTTCTSQEKKHPPLRNVQYQNISHWKEECCQLNESMRDWTSVVCVEKFNALISDGQHTWLPYTITSSSSLY